MSARDGDQCTQCQAMMINGVRCHEHGCPEAWRDRRVECKECGQEFYPDEPGQVCCDESCYCAYYNLPFALMLDDRL